MTDVTTAVHFDHHSPDIADDPYAVFARMRRECPVAWADSYDGFWFLTRYADVVRVARDDETFCSRMGIVIPDAMLNTIPIVNDPPEVQTYRKVLLPIFSPKVMSAEEPAIRQLAGAPV